MAGKKKKIKSSKKKKPSSKGAPKTKKTNSKTKTKKHISTDRKKTAKNKRKKVATIKKSKSKNIKKNSPAKSKLKTSKQKALKSPAKGVKKKKTQKRKTTQSESAKMVRKKIDGQWRDVYYYKDSKGRRRQRLWGDYRKITGVHQPKNIKASQRTMEKQIPPNISRGMKAIAKDENEHSIAMDFEHRGTHPQRVFIMKGGKTATIKIKDFEYYGHTHPGTKLATPSLQDIRTLKPLEPEFVIAGASGKTNIYNIEKPDKLRRHLWHKSHLSMSSPPVEAKDIERQKKRNKWKNDPAVQKITPDNITETKKGREMFLDITGIKTYPLKEKATFVEMKDDPKLEKSMPTIPKEYLEKFQKE